MPYATRGQRRRHVEKKARRKQRALAALKAGDIPMAGEKLPGVWWIEGEDGYFFKKSWGRRAFDINERVIVMLSPADPLAVADIAIKLAQ